MISKSQRLRRRPPRAPERRAYRQIIADLARMSDEACRELRSLADAILAPRNTTK